MLKPVLCNARLHCRLERRLFRIYNNNNNNNTNDEGNILAQEMFVVVVVVVYLVVVVDVVVSDSIAFAIVLAQGELKRPQ